MCTLSDCRKITSRLDLDIETLIPRIDPQLNIRIYRISLHKGRTHICCMYSIVILYRNFVSPLPWDEISMCYLS